MKKFIEYDKDASALELIKVLKEAKKEKLKRIYEIKFNFQYEIFLLEEEIKEKTRELERMAADAQYDRENGYGSGYNDVVYSVH